MNRFLPSFAIFFICLVTLNLWFLSKENISFANDPLRLLSQILALWAIILMAISCLLTTRLKILEDFFGGLDNVYLVHRITGALAFIFAVNHPLLLASRLAREPSQALPYLMPGASLDFNLGVFSLYLLVALFALILFAQMSYRVWQLCHRFLGLAFILGAAHTFLISQDMAIFFPLKLWINSFISLGFYSLIYTIFLYQRFGPKYDYLVDHIERNLDVVNVWLKPVDKVLQFDPGQFVYVNFQSKIFGGELHPFSISSGDCENCIRLSIKILGDYTLKLPELKIGDQAQLFGPYGRLGKAYRTSKVNQCWIGGGIGITPFLSMLRAKSRSSCDNRQVSLVYCFRDNQDGIFVDEVCRLSQACEDVKPINWCSSEKGRINARDLADNIDEIKTRQILLCGPRPMMAALKGQLLALGVNEGNILYEKFQFV